MQAMIELRSAYIPLVKACYSNVKDDEGLVMVTEFCHLGSLEGQL